MNSLWKEGAVRPEKRKREQVNPASLVGQEVYGVTMSLFVISDSSAQWNNVDLSQSVYKMCQTNKLRGP
jgi:hypothetical protein